MASIPTQRWKQVPVSWPRRRCIFPWATRSAAFRVDVEEAVDRLAGQARLRRGQVGVLRGGVVGGRHGVDGGPDDGVVHGFLHPLPEQVDRQVAAAQAGDVVLARADGLVAGRPCVASTIPSRLRIAGREPTARRPARAGGLPAASGAGPVLSLTSTSAVVEDPAGGSLARQDRAHHGPYLVRPSRPAGCGPWSGRAACAGRRGCRRSR